MENVKQSENTEGMEEFCPCCSHHCPVNDLHCGRGREHFGQVPAENDGQEHNPRDRHEHHGGHGPHDGHGSHGGHGSHDHKKHEHHEDTENGQPEV